MTLQPLPPDRRAASAAASGSWWSPGSPFSGTRLAPAAGADAEADAAALSPLATALAACSPAADGDTPASQQASGTRRRCRSPFLARDCSGIDVWAPDRYSQWTRRLEEDGSGDVGSSVPPQTTAAGAAAAAALQAATAGARRPASAAASTVAALRAVSLPGPGLPGRRFAPNLEAAELGAPADSPAAAGRGGRGLRRAFGSVLRWVSGRLQSHPIELTPSEAGYTSCSSSPAGSPQVQASSRSSPAVSRYQTPGSGAGAEAASAPAAAGAAPGGMPRRHLRYASEEEDRASSCGSQGSCTVESEQPAHSWPGPAGARRSLDGSGGGWGGPAAPPDAGHLVLPAWQALLAEDGSAPGSPASSSASTLPLEEAELEAEESSDYQTPPCCSPAASGAVSGAEEDLSCSLRAAGSAGGQRGA